MRMPRPPPPAAALIITGKPVVSTKANAASADSTRPSLPGTVGTPALAAASRAATLSPIRRIAWAVGPTKISPAASTASANSAFSARKAIAGMDGVGARRPGRCEDRVDC